jgi:uncharacterized Zn ribbon protein
LTEHEERGEREEMSRRDAEGADLPTGDTVDVIVIGAGVSG